MLCCACDVESVPDILNAISCVCWTWSHDDSDWMIRVMFPSLCACAVLMPSHRFGMLIFPSKFRYKKRGISRAMEALSRPKKLTSSLYGSIDFMSRARQRFVWMRFACDLFCLLIAFLSSRSGRWAKRLFFLWFDSDGCEGLESQITKFFRFTVPRPRVGWSIIARLTCQSEIRAILSSDGSGNVFVYNQRVSSAVETAVDTGRSRRDFHWLALRTSKIWLSKIPLDRLSATSLGSNWTIKRGRRKI